MKLLDYRLQSKFQSFLPVSKFGKRKIKNAHTDTGKTKSTWCIRGIGKKSGSHISIFEISRFSSDEVEI